MEKTAFQIRALSPLRISLLTFFIPLCARRLCKMRWRRQNGKWAIVPTLYRRLERGRSPPAGEKTCAAAPFGGQRSI